jgi:hypothetical protein
MKVILPTSPSQKYPPFFEQNKYKETMVISFDPQSIRDYREYLLLQNCFIHPHEVKVSFDKNEIRNKKRIESKGNQLFNVPNTKEGREFIEQVKKYANRSIISQIKSRGRGSRKNGKGKQDYIPLDNSEWIALYVEKKIEKKQRTSINKLKAFAH